ncbi:MAG: hypothetical protein LAP21_19965 [Acidobacteriia bacterium]|nr:hypothetical protein [Terriglobia bacterium]
MATHPNTDAARARVSGLPKGRYAWLQVARGKITVNGQELKAGDGAAITAEPKLQLAGVGDSSEVLLFDLA